MTAPTFTPGEIAVLVIMAAAAITILILVIRHEERERPVPPDDEAWLRAVIAEIECPWCNDPECDDRRLCRCDVRCGKRYCVALKEVAP